VSSLSAHLSLSPGELRVSVLRAVASPALLQGRTGVFFFHRGRRLAGTKKAYYRCEESVYNERFSFALRANYVVERKD